MTDRLTVSGQDRLFSPSREQNRRGRIVPWIFRRYVKPFPIIFSFWSTAMLRLLTCLVLGFVLFVTNSEVRANSSLTLAANGKTQWQIVVPQKPTKVDETAAKELQFHLEQMTKARFAIVREDTVDSNAKSLILIGNTKRTQSLLTRLCPDKQFKFDEIFIRAVDHVLVLTGHERRGSLYAVYTFLEDVTGCRWWTEKASFIPDKPVLTIASDLNISYAPKMISREMYHRNASPGIFSARLKGNGNISEEYGGRVAILSFVHSFYKYLPPEKYFLEHPDWYCELDGVRKVGTYSWPNPTKEQQEFLDRLSPEQRSRKKTQLCLTNDEMRKELTRVVLDAIRKKPGTKIVDISQNDWHGYCTCAKCKAIDEHEGSQSGTLIHFLNKVAADIEKEFPDVLVETLAYQYTRKPPKYVKPRHNVLIRLCSIECSFVHELEHEQNKKFASDIEGWSKIAKYLFIWDYVTNYNDYISPFPNYRTLAPNMRYFVKHGAIGMFAEGEGDDFCELRNWTLLHLMWNPDLDEQVLFKDFCDGYYGKEITPILRKYRDLLSDAGEKSGRDICCFALPIPSWLDLATLTQATKLMKSAVETARKVYGDDSPQYERIVKTSLAVDSVWLRHYRHYRAAALNANVPYAGPADPVAAWDTFTKECKKFKISALDIRTPRSTDDEFAKQGAIIKAVFLPLTDLPDFCKGIAKKRIFGFDDMGFNNVNNAAIRVEDPAACDGKATQMSTKVDWNVNYTPGLVGKFRVYVSLRCDASDPEAKALGFGVYDPATKKGLFSKILPAKELMGKTYKWIDYGTIDFTDTSYFYFAHRHSPSVSHIYVDRVILIKDDKVSAQ